jgi:hypothetical protein
MGRQKMLLNLQSFSYRTLILPPSVCFLPPAL